MFEKIVLVIRKTRLTELVERFNTRAQAKFYIEQSGGNFSEYEDEDSIYLKSFEQVRKTIDTGAKIQLLDRSLVPNYLFNEKDLVIVLGQDGLVANTAKYVKGQPIVAVNPDPARFDGILLPFQAADIQKNLEGWLSGKMHLRSLPLAQAKLKDGQRLLAFNDLFIGARSHISARYKIKFNGRSESHSSSGVIISTGAGSTGWLSSLFNQTNGILLYLGSKNIQPLRIEWEERKLIFVVREPFISRHSTAQIVIGKLDQKLTLELESQMPVNGTVFSDGVESDRLDFNSGALASIGLAEEKANLVVNG